MNEQTGKMLIALGGFLLLSGVVLYFFHDKMQWLGKLPGDIRIEKENFSFYFPFTTGILLSRLVQLVLWLWRRLF